MAEQIELAEMLANMQAQLTQLRSELQVEKAANAQLRA